MLKVISTNTVTLHDNSDDDFDGISGVYHSVGIMSTSTVGTIQLEYRVRGHHKWESLSTVDLSDLDNLSHLTFTAPVTHWRLTTVGTDGITTVTDTQVKSSAGLVDSLRSDVESGYSPVSHEHPEYENQFIAPVEVAIPLMDTFTHTHNRGYKPEIAVFNSEGQQCYPALRHVDNNTFTIKSFVPMSGTLIIY